jgi:hypothetical protein
MFLSSFIQNTDKKGQGLKEVNLSHSFILDKSDLLHKKSFQDAS